MVFEKLCYGQKYHHHDDITSHIQYTMVAGNDRLQLCDRQIMTQWSIQADVSPVPGHTAPSWSTGSPIFHQHHTVIGTEGSYSSTLNIFSLVTQYQKMSCPLSRLLNLFAGYKCLIQDNKLQKHSCPNILVKVAWLIHFTELYLQIFFIAITNE